MEELDRELDRLLSPDCRYEICRIAKLNAGEVLVIKIKEEQKGKEVFLSPEYRLEELFGEYMQGKSVEDIARALIWNYLKLNLSRDDLGLEVISSFEKAKDRIFYKTVNTERNRKFLKKLKT